MTPTQFITQAQAWLEAKFNALPPHQSRTYKICMDSHQGETGELPAASSELKQLQDFCTDRHWKCEFSDPIFQVTMRKPQQS